MLIATTPDIPGKNYTVLGIVTASASGQSPDHVLSLLAQAGSKIGADAVIGVQLAIERGSAYVTFYAIGTAVKFA